MLKNWGKRIFYRRNPSYASKAKEVYANAQLYLIENGAHGFKRKHDAIAMGYLDAFVG